MTRILIVEDNIMIADQVEDSLLDNGYFVCGIASCVAEGLAMCDEHHPDLAIIDIRLGHGELGTQMAPKLAPFGNLGILYVTGSSSEFDLSDSDGHACLSKPYIASDLLRALKLVLDFVRTGEAIPPFPPGFRFLGPIDPVLELAS